MNKVYLIAPLCLFLTNCGGLNEPAPERLSGAQSVSLSSAQKKMVSDGVREMVAKQSLNGGEGAKLSGFNAFRLPPNSGIHVCGDVSYQLTPEKPTSSAPYYLELEDRTGALEAKRGQIGVDKLKKSKVIFMCRHANAG